MSSNLVLVQYEDTERVVLDVDRRILSLLHAALESGIEDENNWLGRQTQEAFALLKEQLPRGVSVIIGDLIPELQT